MNIISKIDLSHKSATLIWLCSQERFKKRKHHEQIRRSFKHLQRRI